MDVRRQAVLDSGASLWESPDSLGASTFGPLGATPASFSVCDKSRTSQENLQPPSDLHPGPRSESVLHVLYEAVEE